MERQNPGQVNAFILNFMVHIDTLRMDETDIRNRIEKRFKQNKKERRIRPQHVITLHLEPLVERRWLRLLPDGRYERVGELKHVKPRETLFDQFGNDPELEPYIDSYIHDKEFNRKLFGSEDYEGSMTEEEYNQYMEKMAENMNIKEVPR